jgi:hypothetical protein
LPRLDKAKLEPIRPGSIAPALLRGLLLWIALGLVLLLLAPLKAAANPITDENALTGTPQSTWYRSHAALTTISGYATKSTVAPGEAIGFAVSTTRSYRVIIYRLGWYGGAGARQVACLPSCTTSTTGVARSTPAPNSATGQIDNNWPVQTGMSMTIPSNWTSGEYIAEYVVTSSGSGNNQARYSPFVVRSAAPQAQASKILVVVPQNTYLAYNKFGGTSAYINETNKSVYNKPHATKISLNRPYHTREWSNWDYPLTRFLEREGYDVSYVTDADVDTDPNILQQHQMAIVSGHSEYWTKNMRDGFQAARDNGVSLFFAGANDSFWQVRYEDSSCADNDTVCNTPGDRRTMVIYKMRSGDPVDPISDPALKTIRFRELNRSECEIQGRVQWLDPGYFPNDGYANMTVTSAGAADPWLQGSGLTTGSTIVGMAGTEFDSYWPTCQTPAAPKILFQYQSSQFPAEIDSASVRYQTPNSGARVFSSGNLHFPFTLDSWRWSPSLFTGIPAQDTRMQAFTRNVLADLQRPAPPSALNVSQAGGGVQTQVTARTDTRISSYKIYRHAGSGAFVPTDPGVTLVCQNASGSCADSPGSGTFRYAAVAVDQWGESEAALSSAITTGQATAVAVNDNATVSEDAPATAIDVLANDQDPGGAGKTVNSVTQPTNGTVVITGGGTGLTYQPTANYCNSPPGSSTDTFTYTLNGGSTATVSVTVNCVDDPVDDPPIAVNDSISLTEDSGPNTRTVTSNDTDTDGGPKTIISVTQAAHGTVSIASNQVQVVYRAAADYCNTPPGTSLDTFTYTLNGGSTATVSVTVNCIDDPADDPPIAVNDSISLNQDSGPNTRTVTSNDTDIDGGPKTIISVTQPAHGTVSISANMLQTVYTATSKTYCNTPPGTILDSFTYTLNGGSTATVSVTVNCASGTASAMRIDSGASRSSNDSTMTFGFPLLG